MQDIVLISIPETTIKNIVEQAVKSVLVKHKIIANDYTGTSTSIISESKHTRKTSPKQKEMVNG